MPPPSPGARRTETGKMLMLLAEIAKVLMTVAMMAQMLAQRMISPMLIGRWSSQRRLKMHMATTIVEQALQHHYRPPDSIMRT